MIRELLFAQRFRRYWYTLLAGATGCGKSTQIPQLLLRAGYGRLLCTQPRRLAAMALARRVQLETQGEYGEGVGYQVRFKEQCPRPETS